MGRITDDAMGLLMDVIFGGITNPWAGDTHYFALSTTAINNDGTGETEPSGSGYARVAVTNDATNFPASGTDREKLNGTDITFPTLSGSLGTATHFFIADASSAGNMLAWGALGSSLVLASGVTPQFPAGSLVITGTA